MPEGWAGPRYIQPSEPEPAGGSAASPHVSNIQRRSCWSPAQVLCSGLEAQPSILILFAGQMRSKHASASKEASQEASRLQTQSSPRMKKL